MAPHTLITKLVTRWRYHLVTQFVPNSNYRSNAWVRCASGNVFFKKTCFAGTPYWIYFFPLYTSSSETPAIKIPVINTRRHTQTGKATLGHFLLKSTGLEYARIEWGGSHSVLATGGIQNLWVLSFCQDRMAAAPHLIIRSFSVLRC